MKRHTTSVASYRRALPVRNSAANPVLACLSLALFMAATVVEPAFAAGATDAGKNIGKLLSSWASALFLGVLGLIVIPPLAKRDVGGGLVIVLLAVVLGMFVFYQAGIGGAIKDFGEAALGK